ncbi:PqiC family protein [Tranquillimonas alkanivorans]|uniref:ABC-type transport auxiliary lipoprotein component domain-containing protein n=1 Tax=Tranquillimonas alkanivorans TaxID=441119 RepID=A0A1I5MCR7_9RHOB|nr:ABC-type transport auxiliary lipoprotein family protein [Tranquillimonas alkanivorans]SFP07293.1 hypothetical protein SAMN04488047_102208 [Tranquillimonas alkanivorans]
MRYAAFLLPLALMACGDDITRYAAPTVAAQDSVRIDFRTLEVAEVGLPLYAASEEIWVETPEGALQSSPSLLWADDPARAVTLGLVRNLTEITGARVAPGPWPFEEFPDARLEVQIEEMTADLAGEFRIAGQYFVAAGPDVGADDADLFSLSMPMPTAPSAGDVAAARAAALADLALLIARDGLR